MSANGFIVKTNVFFECHDKKKSVRSFDQLPNAFCLSFGSISFVALPCSAQGRC